MATAKKRSPIWQYFIIDEHDSKFAVCLLCKNKISRGGDGKKAGTSAMTNHLRNKHREEYSTVSAVPSTSVSQPTTTNLNANSSAGKKQLTLLETTERKLLWDINDHKSKAYHYLIAEMIALDNEPLSIVERTGFARLMNKAVPQYKIPSRNYLNDKIIPDIYDRIHSKIKTKISQSAAISVTSDLWTCQHNNASFLSFTAHWLSPEFTLEHGVLAMKPFVGSHTGDNIAKELCAVADVWKIPKEKIHLVVHDSGANMVKGVRVAEFNSARCFIHSLQLAVNESLRIQPEVIETVAAARRIVTHFNHSGIAQEKLKEIRKDINLPDHQLVQDVSTRWNSTYYLMERLLEQKRAVSLYVTDHDTLNNLLPAQWELMEQCIRLLKPFEEITKITSSGLSCISEVIPHVVTLIKYLEKEETVLGTPNLLKMRMSLKTELEQRFDFEENDKYLVATFLDPRFKTSFLGLAQAERARKTILLRALKMSCEFECGEASTIDIDNDYSPPVKKTNNESGSDSNQIHNSFWDCFDEVARGSEQTPDAGKSSAANEIDYFLKTVRLDRREDPFKWWCTNKNQYPILTKIAKVYLSSPCSSVYSERLFSEAGLVYEAKRNRLLPIHAEKLVFIHHNLSLVNFEY